MAEIIIELDNTSERLDELEEDIKAFANTIALSMQRKLLSLGMRDRLELSKRVSKLRKVTSKTGKISLVQEKVLIDSIRGRINTKGGELQGPAWSFERHGIYLEKGVGKYRNVGSPAAKRAAKAWLEPTLDIAVDILADILETKYADIVAGKLRILIPGVIDKTTITK